MEIVDQLVELRTVDENGKFSTKRSKILTEARYSLNEARLALKEIGE